MSVRKRLQFLLPLLLALCLILSGCSNAASEQEAAESAAAAADETDALTADSAAWDLLSEGLPVWDGEPYAELNGNVPAFAEDELTAESFESYSALDELGRCGTAYACIGTDLMPTEERGSISEVHPSGWQSVTYDIVDGNYLYNRCHLIGWQLTGEDANECNLITGTRYLNVEGMLPFENLVADYIEETGNHVLYRVTPVFEGDNLVASGVEMEAYSVEDGGEGVCFHVYCFNVQPGITIDYADGTSCLDEDADTLTEEEAEEDAAEESGDAGADSGEAAAEEGTSEEDGTETTYVLNTKSMKFHYPGCAGVAQMSESNKQTYTGSREELIAMGYSPCGQCSP